MDIVLEDMDAYMPEEEKLISEDWLAMIATTNDKLVSQLNDHILV